jgi:single-stranded-DNA-specific exonuclease
MKHRWLEPPALSETTRQLAAELGVSPLLAQCLVNRGHTAATAGNFLQPQLKRLADPFLLPDMSAAVDRLIAARGRGEALVIFGDYDVDGVSSSALLIEGLRRLGWKVEAYLPHRMDEGYGLSRDGAANCLERFPTTLLLAVDCGSTAVESIAWLKGRGVDVIVLDHHQVSDPLPEAVALVNPQLGSRRSHEAEPSPPSTPNHPPFTELCSVGLAFKLVHALTKRGRELGWPEAQALDIREFLDLVALGTIADLVPLTGENRILVSSGLPRLTTTKRPGLIALKEVAGIEEDVDVRAVGFGLGPRLNAAGRLENADESLRLLLAKNANEAMPLAQSLDTKNRERQRIEKEITQQVIGAVRARFNPETDYVIVEGQLLWHIGVVGIVASRVLQEFYRPTLIIGGEGESWRGSGRSIEGFDLAAALRECDDLLIKHGGHAMAAGITVHPDRLDTLRQRLNGLARTLLSQELLRPALRLDAVIGLSELNEELVTRLAVLEPFGMGNPAVQVIVPGVRLERPLMRMGKEKQHVRLRVTDGKAAADAVWWNVPPNGEMPSGTFDLACVPQLNEYNGRTSVQLRLLDWRGLSR